MGAVGQVRVISAVMMRTASAPRRDRCEPSSRRASTGSLRLLRSRARNRAPTGQLGKERLGVEPAVDQHQHVGAQQRQQLSRVIDFAGGRCPEHRAQQRSGAGLDHRHQPDHRITGRAQRGAELAQPGPVALGVGHLERHAPVERHGAVAAEPYAGGVRRGDRSGQHLEQRPHRRRAQAAPQVSKGFGRWRLPAAHRGGEFGPHLAVAQPGEQAQRQHEVHPDPRRQRPQPPLGGPGLGQHRIDQLDRDLPGQLPEMAGGEHSTATCDCVRGRIRHATPW